MPRLVATARVVGSAAVTCSGVVTQEGHCLLLVSSPKVRASLSTGTFKLEPPGQVATPAGPRAGAGPVKIRSPSTKSALSWPDGKPPLGPDDRSSGERTTRPVRQALASGERAQATASCRASASKAPTFTAPGGGPAAGRADDDAGTPTPPTYVADGPAADVPPVLAAHPATATAIRPRQAANSESDRRLTPAITASRKASPITDLDASRPALVPPHSETIG